MLSCIATVQSQRLDNLNCLYTMKEWKEDERSYSNGCAETDKWQKTSWKCETLAIKFSSPDKADNKPCGHA